MIERVANGGIPGEDVTVVNTSPQRHINIQGIDNHDITSTPIATVGALDHSQSGPVIIIMKQYRYNGKEKNTNYSVHLEGYNND